MRSKFKWIFTLLMALSMQFSFAQEKTVTGVVRDASGTLPGANVVVEGTTRGTQTDIDGRYSISASAGEVIVISFVGMADFRATVGASNVVNATLAEGGMLLTEVVVQGALGITRTRDAVTSSQQVVRAEELTQAANPNVIQSLAGKVSGLQINTTNNGVNATTRIVLRGNRSLTGNNQALIVIDNAISTAAVLQSLSPELIESTNVIKGAQGAALYGSDGANGVIIVTTKRGAKGGKAVVSINSAVDFEEVSMVPDRQQRYGQGWSGQHITYENGAWGAEMDGSIRTVGMAQADGSYITAPYSPINDNIKKFFNTGTVTQLGFSINSGDENGYASLSANRQNTEFVVTDDKLDRNSFVFKAGKTLGKWRIEGIANYVTAKTQTTSSALFTELLQAGSNIPVEQFSNPRNEYHWTSYYRSPYWMRENIRNEARRDFFSGIATINYKLNDNINFNYNANVQTTQLSELDYTNEYTDILLIGGGNNTTVSEFSQENFGRRYIYADFLANFNYDLTDKLNLKFNLGNNIQDRMDRITTAGGTNLTIPGVYAISNVESPDVRTFNAATGALENGMTRRRSFAFFANVDLAYDDFLFLNVTGRNDWTSLLDESNNSYFYPSAGLSFVPTKAFDALDNKDGLSYMKIAASWVRIGNNNVTEYAINNLYTSGTGYPFGNNNSFAQQQSNTDAFIEPEFYTTKDITVNMEFFKRRLTLDVALFRTDTENLNTRISTSSASGLTSSNVNLAQSKTEGYEIDLGFTPIDNKELGLKWENRVSLSSAITTVLRVSPDSKLVSLFNNANLSGGIGIFALEGEEFPLIRGIGYQRDDQGRVIVDAATGRPERTLDYITLGKATPDYILGYNTSVDFKGFRLAAVMDYRTGHQFYSGTKQWLSWSGHLYDSAENGRTGFVFPNSSIQTSPGVFAPNTNVVTGGTTYASYISYFQDEYAETAENFVLDATAFKVREISLSYSFPSDVITRAGISSLRLGVNARNPFMILPEENRDYNDPEQSRSSGNDAGYAITGQYPQTRTFGFSVNLTF